MSQAKKSVVVSGDVTVDWFLYPVAAADEGENWRLHSSFYSSALPGGAALLADFVKSALAARNREAETASPRFPQDLRNIPPERFIHSNVMLGDLGASGPKKPKALRVEKWLGYIGPQAGLLDPLPPTPDPELADLIVLDDAGNAFRRDPHAWPRALATAQDSTIIYKMSRPLVQGKLWEGLSKQFPENLVVVVHLDDLRRTKGVQISRALSWERTAKDFVFQLQRSDKLETLRRCPYLVVMAGTDGAILCRGAEGGRATLVFDPFSREGGFADRVPGGMVGLTSVFTATLVGEIAADGLAALESAMKLGLLRSRRMLEAGFALTNSGIAYPAERVFAVDSHDSPYASCPIDQPTSLRVSDPHFWRILDRKAVNTLQLAAEQIVVKKEVAGLRGVPVGVFGKLETIDRAEIESYSAIRELIIEFLANPKPERPLCFAVFGPPGSGKSFGVKQVLKSINNDNLQSITFNISQYADYSDLVSAFHAIRDISLQGKAPFVFFDEFDSPCGDHALGWLQYFLAPMQDAEFKDRDAVHPVGKAVFVFAGGTRSSFDKFVRNMPDDENSGADPQTAEDAFRSAKGPDFVSRLRGFINVMGPNRQRTPGDDDEAFIIRRAKVLRVMLRSPKTEGLFNSQGDLNIDDSVLRAMLHVRKYKHGARSMAAIIDMSRLAGKNRFDLSALPPKEQLDLHVDADEFLFLTQRERFQSMLRLRDFPHRDEALIPESEASLTEAAAELIHKYYVKHRELDDEPTATSVPFEDLTEEKKRSNLDAAEDIPAKLRAIGHGIRKISKGPLPRTPDISDEEVEKIALMEHDRWLREQRIQGFSCGPERDPRKKTSPYLVPYDRVPGPIQAIDVEAAYALPMVLGELGYEIYRMEEVEEFHDPLLIEELARILHERYVAERANEGETIATNSSMVDFDKLTDDLKEANRDNATAIPRKLKQIKYDIRRLERGEHVDLPKFTDDEIEQMAKMEHARWNWQKIMQGWVYGPERDSQKKTSPYLIPWARLRDHIQEYDRQTVRVIPELLQQAGYLAYKP